MFLKSNLISNQCHTATESVYYSNILEMAIFIIIALYSTKWSGPSPFQSFTIASCRITI